MNLPTPDRTTYKGGDSRMFTTEWVVDEDEHGSSDDLPITAVVQLSSSHDKNRKACGTTLRVTKRECHEHSGRMYTTDSYWLFDFVRIGSPTPIARFSPKALKDHHERMLIELANLAEADHEGVCKMFASKLADVGIKEV